MRPRVRAFSLFGIITSGSSFPSTRVSSATGHPSEKKHKLETHKRNGVGRFIDVCSIRAGRVRTLIAEKIASQALQNNTSRLHQHYDGE